MKKIKLMMMMISATVLMVNGCGNDENAKKETVGDKVELTTSNITENQTSVVEEEATEQITNETSIEEKKSLIKEIKKLYYDMFSNEYLMREQEYYDEKGRMVKRQEYLSGTAYGWDEYQYSGDGKSVKILCKNSKGEVYLEQKILYDDNNNKIEFIEFEDDKVVTDITYLYDENGNLIEECDALFCEFNKNNYEYDEYGYKTKKIVQTCALHDNGGNCKVGCNEKYYDNEYDEQGRIEKISERVWVSHSGTEKFWIATYTEYIYDNKGKLVKENEYDLYEENLYNLGKSIEYSYDELGKIIDIKVYDGKGELDSYIEYVYYD